LGFTVKISDTALFASANNPNIRKCLFDISEMLYSEITG
jgi:hypothetical protein